MYFRPSVQYVSISTNSQLKTIYSSEFKCLICDSDDGKFSRDKPSHTLRRVHILSRIHAKLHKIHKLNENTYKCKIICEGYG